MSNADRRSRISAARALTAIATVALLLLAISILDASTGLFHFTVLYAVPIIVAAWAFGLVGGLTTGAIALATVAATHSLRHSPTLAADIATDVVVFLFAAVVVDRLRRQLRTVRALQSRRDFDLQIARDIQQRILSEPPTNSSFDIACSLRFAYEIGGDYYRFDSTTGGLFVCVADISGKGTPAALFATLLDETLTTALADRASLERTVATLNARMYESMPPEMFVTMFLALLDDDSIRYVNAGHVRPLLFEAATDKVTELKEAGVLPLGISPENEAHPATRRIATGDVLLLCSDGVTESPKLLENPNLLERIFEETAGLGPQAVVDRLAELAVAEGQSDDVTVICLRRR